MSTITITKKAICKIISVILLIVVAVSYKIHNSIFISYIAISVLISIFAFDIINKTSNVARESLSVISAILSSIAIFAAAYWFMFERPGETKLDVTQQTSVFEIAPGRVLLLTEVQLKNVGNTAIDFGDGSLGEIHIGRVLPSNEKDDSAPSMLETGVIYQNDNWPDIASGQIELQGIIESGEVERIYFRSVVDCEPGSVFSTKVKVPKLPSFIDQIFGGSRPLLYWITQSPIDARTICS